MNELLKLVPRAAESRNGAPKKFKIIRDDSCINCGTCISACIYDCHERNTEEPRTLDDPKADCCRNCFSCVLRCPRGSLSMEINPGFTKLGDGSVFTSEMIQATQEQAADGKIPVSGSAYGGPFSGSGYDNMWTDMSEIVRPTRDGIHGREHISTTVYLGRKIRDLCGMQFDSSNHLTTHIPPSREIPVPVIFGLPPFDLDNDILTTLALAASKLNTLCAVPVDKLRVFRGAENEPGVQDFFNHLIIRMHPSELETFADMLTWASMVEFEPGAGQLEAIDRARQHNSQVVSILRAYAKPGVEDEVLRLAESGAEVIHIVGDYQGGAEDGKLMIDWLHSSHLRLVEAGLRDQVTLLASGGIAMAEHVPKTIVLGADAVLTSMPLLFATESVICSGPNASDPFAFDPSWGSLDGCQADRVRWGATRVINLVLSWKDQLLEVLGAMGLRDVRRLRGETGRAIFADQARAEFLEGLEKANGAEAKQETVDELVGNADESGLPGRFPQELSRWIVRVDRDRCVDCGICVDTCRPGVHRRFDGKALLGEPIHSRCLGPSCEADNEWCCITQCPWEALSVEASKIPTVLGDRRWTAALLSETFKEAASGEPARAAGDMLGASGGGFDELRLSAHAAPANVLPEEVDLSISLNKRKDFAASADIPLPFYGGGMSYGSISLAVMRGRAMAAQQLGTFTSTGEGGYPDELIPFKDHVITQIATGLFGVREETIRRSRMVEFKYAQGAKPGLGGHLLGSKNTPKVAEMREAVPGTALFSPFPFHSVYSVEDHKKHLDWIRAIHPEVLMSVKVSTPSDVDMVAVGSFYAGANVVNLDGAYGGTGAAPNIAKKNIAMPIELAVRKVHTFLDAEGIRGQVALITGGGIRSADDALKAIALGADGVAIGTAELVAIDCVKCGNCERGRGCPIGIATTDPHLSTQLESEWVRDRIVNMYDAWTARMRRRLSRLGYRSVHEFCGATDTLKYLEREMGHE